VKSKQHYVPKFNLGTREKNVKLQIEVVNVVYVVIGNDSKPSSLRGDVFAPNNGSDHEDSLEAMPSLVDDSHEAFLVQNVEQIQHVYPKGNLTHSYDLVLSSSFSKFAIIDEN